MSKWEHIFKGEVVDLDKILSSLHCVTVDPERKAHIGDTEICIGGVETKKRVETSSGGLRHGNPLHKQLLVHLSTGSENWLSMGITSSAYLLPNDQDHTTKLSSLTKVSGTKWVGGKKSYSLTTSPSLPSMQRRCRMTELSTSKQKGLVVEDKPLQPSPISVIGSTVRVDVDSQTQDANIIMHAKAVAKQGMERGHVGGTTEEEMFGMRPRYLRYNLWTPNVDPMVTAAEWMLSARPLLQTSQNGFRNSSVNKKINENLSLFEIVMPVKVEALEQLLKAHSNRALSTLC